MKNQKNKRLGSFIAIFLVAVILSIMPVLAEVTLWTSTIVNNQTQIVRYHAYYQISDTSVTNVGKVVTTPILLYYTVEPLPFNLTYGQVDWCNFTVIQFHNIYEARLGGNFERGDYALVNTSLITQSIYFSNSGFSSGVLQFDLLANDNIVADMDCHYTNVNSLFQDEVLIGRFTTFMPSYKCEDCTQYTLEELSDLTKQQANVTANSIAVYDNIQKIINYNFQIWVIFSWVVKIGFIILAVGLVFSVGYSMYKYLVELEKEI